MESSVKNTIPELLKIIEKAKEHLPLILCQYCNCVIDEADNICPHCGE